MTTETYIALHTPKTVEEYCRADPKHRFFSITLAKISSYSQRLPRHVSYATVYRANNYHLDRVIHALESPVTLGMFKRQCQELMLLWLVYVDKASAQAQAEKLGITLTREGALL